MAGLIGDPWSLKRVSPGIRHWFQCGNERLWQRTCSRPPAKRKTQAANLFWPTAFARPFECVKSIASCLNGNFHWRAIINISRRFIKQISGNIIFYIHTYLSFFLHSIEVWPWGAIGNWIREQYAIDYLTIMWCYSISTIAFLPFFLAFWLFCLGLAITFGRL